MKKQQEQLEAEQAYAESEARIEEARARMIEEIRQEEQRAQEERLRQEEQRKAKENEAQIIYKLHELGEKGKKMMPKIEALYRRQQQAQRQGILSNPGAQFDLNDAIGELIDIKNEQIRLAEQLGDQKLVKEYKDQRSQIYKAKDKMLYGI